MAISYPSNTKRCLENKSNVLHLVFNAYKVIYNIKKLYCQPKNAKKAPLSY